jgi:glucose-1-phosphate thymidylyltransferase
MKALVLAGGVGLRLRPISHTLPKQLVPVANQPVLHHGLRALVQAGITDIGVIVGDHAAEIRHSVGDGAAFGARVTYLPQDQPRGLADCVLVAREFLGDEDFLMYLGDIVAPKAVAVLVERFAEVRPAAMVLVGAIANPTECGVAEVDGDGRVLGVQEKSPNPRGNLAMIGVYAFTAAIHEAVRSISPSWRSELEITDAVQWLVERGSDVRAHVFTDFWRDTGRVENLLDCNRQIMSTLRTDVRGKIDGESEVSGPVVLGDGSQVMRSRIVGPVVIGANTVISDSYVGPYTAIGDDCLVCEAGVDHSIVLERSSVCCVRHVRDSLIGRGVVVRPAEAPGGTHRFVVGDDSLVFIEMPGAGGGRGHRS